MTLQEEINHMLALSDNPTEEELEEILFGDKYYHIFTDKVDAAVQQLPLEQQNKVLHTFRLLHELSDQNM